jgi:glycosyltransferase involved in cell wall biosynthesis
MRLLIVSDTFTPDVNGVARTLQHWASGMSALGHTVDVVTTSPPPDFTEPYRRHVVLSMPLPGYNSIRVGFAGMAWFQELFTHTRAEVLYVATETPMGVAAIWAARRAGLPVISGFHTNFHTYLKNYHLTSLQTAAETLLSSIHNQTFRTLVPSIDTAEVLRSMGVIEVGVLGRGVDTTLFSPTARDAELRRSWGCDQSTPVALHVGRLAEEKNLPLLERAFTSFLQLHPHGRCVVVGDGPSGDRLRQTQPDWIFAGMRSGADLARHYASGDVFIFPSLSETFGNVVTEALASGLVVAAYDYAAAHAHIQHGQSGFLAAPGDEATFLSQINEAAIRWDSPTIRAAARATALELGWNRITAAFEQHLQDALTAAATSSNNNSNNSNTNDR